MDYTTELAMRGLHKFIEKWSYAVLIAREAEKNKYKHENNI